MGRYDKVKQLTTTQQEPKGASPFIRVGKLTTSCRRSGCLHTFILQIRFDQAVMYSRGEAPFYIKLMGSLAYHSSLCLESHNAHSKDRQESSVTHSHKLTNG